MTRRRVVFVRKDGRRYITEEFNGDKAEYAARGDCLDGCDLDWPEIRALFVAADTYLKFIKANLTAQAAYHSFLVECRRGAQPPERAETAACRQRAGYL